MMVKIAELRRLILTIADKLSFLAPTLARLVLAAVFIESGWGKLNDLQKVTDFFTTLGIPMPGVNAAFSASTEFICGILVLVGLLTRVAAVPLAVIMMVAIATAKIGDVEGVTGFLTLDEFIYIVLCIWLAANGPGPLSIDHLLAKRFFARKS